MDRPELSPLRFFGDPSLTRALRAALDPAGFYGLKTGADLRSTTNSPRPLDVISTRRGVDDRVISCARQSAHRRRSILLISISWGRGAVGPLVPHPATSACLGCLRAREVERGLADGPQDVGAPAELRLLPSLVAAAAAVEIQRFWSDATPASVGAQILVTPYAGWSLASTPVLTRTELDRHAACSCWIAESGRADSRWDWVEARGSGPHHRRKADRPLSSQWEPRPV